MAATTGAAAFSLAPGVWADGKRIGMKPVRPRLSGSVAVVGAGIAGLACATELSRQGLNARVFEASDRVGGRIASLRDVFPGQVAERGAELIDTTHVTLRNLAVGMGLTLEDYNKEPGEPTYFFDGRTFSEAEVVAEYRALTAAMTGDLKQLSNGGQ